MRNPLKLHRTEKKEAKKKEEGVQKQKKEANWGGHHQALMDTLISFKDRKRNYRLKEKIEKVHAIRKDVWVNSNINIQVVSKVLLTILYI